MPVYSRRTVLGAGVLALGGVLAACSAPAAPTAAPTQPPAKPAEAPKPAEAAKPTEAPKPAAVPQSGNPDATKPAASAAAPAPTAPAKAPEAAATKPATADGVVPSPAKGVPDAFLKLPAKFRSVEAVPGKGGKLTTFIQSYSPPHAPKGENRYWQEWEKRVNVAYEPTVVPADNYREKLAAVTASGDLPDLTTVELLNAPDHFRVVQQGAYTDLTPYLTGENLKRFPNLARIPQYGWDNSKVNGKIWGVPSVRFLPDFNMVWRADWAQKLGGQPKNKNDFMELMKAFTQKDPDGNGKADSYGMGSWTPAVFNLDIMQHMFRAPNQWRLAGGKLTHVVETEEFKAAVEYMRKLSEAGIYHPDAGSMTIQQAKDGLAGDKFGGYGDGWTAVITQRDNAQKANRPRSSVEMFIPPGHDGGQGVTYNSSGYFGFAAIPAKVGKDQSRVEELLRICDFNCAPFGAEEFLFVRYGIEGYHYDLKDGAPILNDNGRKDIGALTNFSRRNDVFYYPTAPDDARFMQNTCRDFLAIGIDNPCLTAYSPTWVAKAGELNQLRIDRISAIVTGRDPLSKLDDYVKEWRSRAGDQARREYEEVLAKG